MPRKIVSALLTAGVVLLVIMLFVSDPPPPSSASAGSSAADEPGRDAQEERPQLREAVTTTTAGQVAPAVEPLAEKLQPTTPISQSHQNPPGMLEVLVLLDDQPLAGASVRLLRGGGGSADLETTIEDAAPTPTDARGIARFEGLDGDRILIAEVRSEPDVIATVHTTLKANEPTWRIVVHLGGGGVEGRAFAHDGSPQEDLRIALQVRSRSGGHTWTRVVHTGADGTYRIAGIPPGKATIYAADPESEVERQVDLEFTAGEWKHVDLGSPQRALRWSGRVVLASGANAEGFATFEVRALGSGEQISVACTPASEFSVQLAPGEYSASSWTGAGPTEYGKITLVDRDLVRDLAIPGIQVRGRVTYSGTYHDPAQPAASVQVWFEKVGGSKYTARRNADDRFVTHCLAPGEYLVTTWPNPLLGAGAKGVRLQLDGSRDDVVLDLTITDP